MTFHVFIGYGDVQAKTIAKNLGHYLRRFGMSTFVASTDPAWMLPGSNVNQIYQRLRISDILIAVCTSNTQPTSKLGKEIRFARANKMPVLPFLENGMTPPFGLHMDWYMTFDLQKPWTQHRAVATYVLWQIEKSMEAVAQII